VGEEEETYRFVAAREEEAATFRYEEAENVWGLGVTRVLKRHKVTVVPWQESV
jgi:hypothetical protein